MKNKGNNSHSIYSKYFESEKSIVATKALHAMYTEDKLKQFVRHFSNLFTQIKERKDFYKSYRNHQKQVNKGVGLYHVVSLRNSIRMALDTLNNLRSIAVDLDLTGVNLFMSDLFVNEILQKKNNDVQGELYSLKLTPTPDQKKAFESQLVRLGLQKQQIAFLMGRVMEKGETTWKVVIPDETGAIPHPGSIGDYGIFHFDIDNLMPSFSTGSGGGSGSGGGGGGGGGVVIEVNKGLSELLFRGSDYIQNILQEIIAEEIKFGTDGFFDDVMQRGEGNNSKRHAAADFFHNLATAFAAWGIAVSGWPVGGWVLGGICGAAALVNVEAESAIRPDTANPFGHGGFSHFVDP